MSVKEMETNEAVEWITGVLEEPPNSLTADTLRESVVGWDSLGILNLMARFDEDFDIILSDTEVEGLESVKGILDVFKENGVLTEG